MPIHFFHALSLFRNLTIMMETKVTVSKLGRKRSLQDRLCTCYMQEHIIKMLTHGSAVACINLYFYNKSTLLSINNNVVSYHICAPRSKKLIVEPQAFGYTHAEFLIKLESRSILR